VLANDTVAAFGSGWLWMLVEDAGNL